MTEIVIQIATALVQGIPKLIAAVKAGRNPGDVKLSEFISTDAIATIDEAINTSRSFEDKFND